MNTELGSAGFAAPDVIPHPSLTDARCAKHNRRVSRLSIGEFRLSCIWQHRFIPRILIATPFTLGYVAILICTTLYLNYGRRDLVDKMLALSSTDLPNLAKHLVSPFLTSTIWAADEPGASSFIDLAVTTLIFCAIVASLERRVGSGRTALVFFTGHIVATVLTLIVTAVATANDMQPASAAHWLDVGVSYGFFAAWGALIVLRRGYSRFVTALALEGMIALIYFTDTMPPFPSMLTTLGHLSAAHLGMIFWRQLLRFRDHQKLETHEAVVEISSE